MKLKDLYESQGKSLIGMHYLISNPECILPSSNEYDEKIHGTITEKTKEMIWNDGFSCISLQLTSLDGSPKKVEDYFSCTGNNLSDLKGAPEEVLHNFLCSNNNLTSLEGAPKIIGGCLDVPNNRLTSLKDIHKHIKELGEDRTHTENSADLYVYNNPIKSHILGVLLIKNCKKVMFVTRRSGGKSQEGELGKLAKVENIINKYLPNTEGHKAVAKCQDELIEADLDEYAQL